MSRTHRFLAASLWIALWAIAMTGCSRGGGNHGLSDKSPPSVTIETPTTADTYLAGATPLALGGTAADDAGLAAVTWSNADTGGSGIATGTDAWTASVPLALGDNVITVTAEDVVGKTGTDSITVTLDQADPVVIIDTPTTASNYGTFSPAPLGIGGTASDDLGVALVEWSNAATGASGTATGTTTWTAAVALAFGVNGITVTATDVSGRTGTDSITVTLSLGELYSWGSNGDGQLGDGVPPIYTEPVKVVDPNDPSGYLTGGTAIAGGGHHTMAVLGDMTVRAWGWNALYQLGDGTTTDSSTPVQVEDPLDPSGFLTGAVEVAAGWYHSLARMGDGTVWAWGSNSSGQLGDGTTITRSTPVQVVDPLDPSGFLTGVIAVRAGGAHSLALKGDGTVWAWGDNYHGHLGDGTTIDRWSAVQVIDPLDPSGFLTGAVGIGTRGYHSAAVLADGTVRCWGRNWDGQIGDGSTTERWTPTQVRDPLDPSGFLSGVVAVAAGGEHTAALKGDGTVWAWGGNGDGQLGDGTGLDSLRPAQVVDPLDPTLFLSGVTSIDAGYLHMVALRSDNTVRAWGANAYGQVGDGTTTSRIAAVQVRDPSDPSGFLTNVSAIAAGWYHSVSLQIDGTVRTWGRDWAGQAGSGSARFRDTVVRVVDPSDPTGWLTAVVAPSCGSYHSLALRGDGTVRSWGWNDYGQLGDGRSGSSGAPIQVVDPNDPSGLLTAVQGVSGGHGHSAALMNDGTVRAWGLNTYGQLGNGTTVSSLTPVRVGDPISPFPFDRVTAVATGVFHTVALRDDGTVWTWGDNRYGELGLGTTTPERTPQQVLDPMSPTGFLEGAAAIASGRYHTLAVMADGTVRAWGRNWNGQLGDGTSTDQWLPVQVVDPSDPSGNLTGAVAVSGGESHTLALKGDGTVRAFGSNSSLQLGDPGAAGGSSIPVQVTDPADPTGFLTGVEGIAAGGYHSVALKSDGTVRSWGSNSDGQLGAGSIPSSSTPVQVIDPSDPTGYLTGVGAVRAGQYHCLALK